MRKTLYKDAPPVASLGNPERVAQLVARALDEAYVVRIAGPVFGEATFRGWEAVVRAMGTPCCDGEDGVTGVKDGSLWSDVRYDETRTHTFRHSATAQPLHTDSAYNENPTEIIFFLGERQAAQGGETIFIDAETVDRIAAERDPALHAQLWNLAIPYGKGDDRGRSAPVLKRDAGGMLLNWNYFRVLEESPEIVSFRQRFRDFLQQEILDKNLVTPVMVRPGDALFFADQRVLHGRFGFIPSPRCIWKCSFDRARA